MNYNIVEKYNKKYIEITDSEIVIKSEQDALDIIGSCMGSQTEFVIIHEGALSEDFFILRTGLAGSMLQKFMNYHIKAALITINDRKDNKRYSEMILEANKGNNFRTFTDKTEAEEWLLK